MLKRAKDQAKPDFKSLVKTKIKKDINTKIKYCILYYKYCISYKEKNLIKKT